MTETEYTIAASRLRTLWPSLTAWFGELSAECQAGIRERWRLCLLPCEAQDVEVAILSLASQRDDPWPWDRDKERAAAIVAEKANARRWERKASQELAPLVSGRPSGDSYPAGYLFREISHRIAADARHSQECREHRATHGRCLGGCAVAKIVAEDVLVEWDTCERTGRSFVGRESEAAVA